MTSLIRLEGMGLRGKWAEGLVLKWDYSVASSPHGVVGPLLALALAVPTVPPSKPGFPGASRSRAIPSAILTCLFYLSVFHSVTITFLYTFQSLRVFGPSKADGM